MPEDAIPALKTLLETAAKQSPTVLGRAIQVEQMEAAVYQSVSAMLPNVGGGFSFASSTVYPKEGDSNRSSGPYYNLGVSQNVFQWNALKNQATIARIGVNISQKNYAEAYRGLMTSIRVQFLGLIYKKINLKTQRFNLGRTKKNLALDEEKLKAGALSPVDLILPRMGSAEAELAMVRSDEDYEHSKRTLLRLAGVDSLDESLIPEEIPKWRGSPELASALEAVIKRDGIDVTIQGKVNSLNLKVDELNYKINKVRLYPKFSASAGVSQSNSQNVTPTSATQSSAFSYNYGIAASWNIFDGFATRGAKLATLAAKRGHELERTQMLATLLEDVRYLNRLINSSAKYLELVEQRHSGSAQTLELTKEELKRGTVSEAAVDTATAGLYVADGSVAVARLDLHSRWVELVSLLNADPMLEKLPSNYVH